MRLEHAREDGDLNQKRTGEQEQKHSELDCFRDTQSERRGPGLTARSDLPALAQDTLLLRW